jgi:hypothetical protein
MSTKLNRWRNQFNPGIAAHFLSFDHLIRSHQYIRRNCQTNLLGGFEIDDELELRRLLDRKVSRFCVGLSSAVLSQTWTVEINFACSMVDWQFGIGFYTQRLK